MTAACASDAVDPALVTAVEEALGGAAAWDGFTGALAAAIGERERIPRGVARELEARLGEWHRDRRGDPESAEEAFVRALAHAPDGESARSADWSVLGGESARSADRSVLGGESARSADWSAPRDAELLAALAQLQRRTKGRPLVDSLLRLSAATGGDLDLLREAADIARNSVADRALAKSIIERVLRLAIERWLPTGEDAVTIGSAAGPSAYVEWAIGEMSSIHEEEEDPSKIVDLLLETSRLPFPREQARVMRHEAARVAADRLGDVERSIAIWTSLFEEDAHDAGAVARLVTALDAHGRRAELLDVRRKQVLSAKSVAMRVAVRLEVARLESALGETEAAIASLEANLEEEGRHQETVSALVELLDGAGRSGELAALLSRQAERQQQAAELRAAADLWTRAADVAETRLGDASLAIANHRRVIALEPRARSLDALARLLGVKGEWDEAARHLDALLAECEPNERARVALRLAEALIAAGDEDGARARLEDAFARDPSSEEVVARLAATYRARHEWRRLADLLAKSASHARDKATRLAALREAAALHRNECETPAEAVPLLEQASDLDPDDRALRVALADALGAAQRYGEARSVLRALIDGFGGRRPKERAPVHYHLARLDLALGDRAQALVELDAATRIDPANPEILRTLAELARDDGQLERAERSFRALLAVLRRVEEPAADAPIVRTEVLVQLAALARGEKELDRAAELVESALEIAAKNGVEAVRFEKALRAQGDLATLSRALEARIARGGEAEAVALALADLAQILDAARATGGRPRRRAPRGGIGSAPPRAPRNRRDPGAALGFSPRLRRPPDRARRRSRRPARRRRGLRSRHSASPPCSSTSSATTPRPRATTSAPSASRSASPRCSARSTGSTSASATRRRRRASSQNGSTSSRCRAARSPPPTRSTGSRGSSCSGPTHSTKGAIFLLTALRVAPDYERAKAVLDAARSIASPIGAAGRDLRADREGAGTGASARRCAHAPRRAPRERRGAAARGGRDRARARRRGPHRVALAAADRARRRRRGGADAPHLGAHHAGRAARSRRRHRGRRGPEAASRRARRGGRGAPAPLRGRAPGEGLAPRPGARGEGLRSSCTSASRWIARRGSLCSKSTGSPEPTRRALRSSRGWRSSWTIRRSARGSGSSARG